jgi:hypothetical protein
MGAIRITRRLDSETLHLPELRPLIGHDIEIVVTDKDRASKAAVPGARAASILASADRAGAAIPAEVRQKLPRDGAAQHDHYLYGTPKR